MFNTFNEQLLYTALKLTVFFGTEKGGEATGFFVADTSSDNNTAYLVTNRHVVDRNYKKNIGSCFPTSLRISGAFFCACGGKHMHNLQINNPSYFEVANSEDDVAVLALSDPELLQIKNEGCNVKTNNWINIESLADDESFKTSDESKSIRTNDEVITSKYMCVGKKTFLLTPCASLGHIMSDTKHDIDLTLEDIPGKRIILYQNFSMPGDSGSPVFATQRGIKSTGSIDFGVSRPFKLVGVNSGHTILENGKIVKEHLHPGVSFFVKSSVILETIEKINKR